MQIESIRVKNFRVFQNLTLKNLPNFGVFIGANGTGKTTLFDVFGFLHDALIHNVRQAIARRGGFKEVISRNQSGNLEFEIKFRDRQVTPSLVTYFLEIGLTDHTPLVKREILKYRRGQRGQPWHFLDFQEGEGQAVTNEGDYQKNPAAQERHEKQVLESPETLAIKGLGHLQKFKIVSAFRKLIEHWHVSDFHISEARPSQTAGYAEHLSPTGDNLALVAQQMWERQPEEFQKVLQKMTMRVPGVTKVEPATTEDGRILLRFQDGSFQDPFIAKYVSDGTIKMFAYLLLLHDLSPHPLLCVEEPENQLYPRLLGELVEEFRDYARRGGQVLVSTHSPDFLNHLKLEETFWLTKQHGYTQVRCAVEDKQLQKLVAEGDSLGNLWKQGFFESNEGQR